MVYFRGNGNQLEGLHYSKIVIPWQVRKAILRHLHDDPTSGHLGQARTLHRIRRFFWPGLENDVRECCMLQMCEKETSSTKRTGADEEYTDDKAFFNDSY